MHVIDLFYPVEMAQVGDFGFYFKMFNALMTLSFNLSLLLSLFFVCQCCRFLL